VNRPTEIVKQASEIASAILQGFDKHYRIFRACAVNAKDRFEAGDWHGIQKLVRDRIQYYDDRVLEVVETLRVQYSADHLDDDVWRQTKLTYLGLLIEHKQPECAETFFNSVCCKILHRTYFHNEFIFFQTRHFNGVPGVGPPYLPCVLSQ